MTARQSPASASDAGRSRPERSEAGRAAWPRLPRLARRFGRDRRGATAIEFAMLALPFFAIIAATFEVGYCNYANEMLANSVGNAARAMLTGGVQTANVTTAQQFVSTYLCPTTGRELPLSFNCANLIVDVRPAASFAAGDTSNDFYASATNVFCPGQPGQIMVLRVAYPLAAMFPANLYLRSAGVVTNVPNLPGRFHILMASALFQEENYAGTYTPPSGC